MTTQDNPISTRSSNERRLFIARMILLAAWIMMTLVPIFFKDQTGRLFADYEDRTAYYLRGNWLPQHSSALSEYPQIPTLLFGLNHLVSMGVAPGLQLSLYVAVFSLEMMVVLYFLFKVLLELLPERHRNGAFLLLLPPALYFTYNRFDILPAFLCLLAYSAATRRQWLRVAVILALATLTKWYPALLLPGFLVYAGAVERKFQWKMIAVFAATVMGVTLLAFFQGGFAAILAPYQFHTSRSMEYAAFPVLINNLLQNLLHINVNLQYFLVIFFLLQICAPVLVFMIKIDTLAKLTDYCLIVTAVFMLFSRIWSPQWFLWLIPFVLLTEINLKTAGLVIAYNLLTYLSFPIIFDTYGSSSIQLQIVSVFLYVVLFVIILRSLTSLRRESHKGVESGAD
jgi:hypothetical protein